jgi:tripartite ATP-independent transporter DctM subunit
MAFFLFLVAFVVLFLLGTPIAFAMIASSVVYALSAGVDMAFFSMEAFTSLQNFMLTAIPMFMLTAEVMNSSTVADRMFNFANSMVGWIPGGLGHTNVLTSVIFAGMSGSAAADASGIGYLSYRAMKDRGFDGPFSAAVTAASSCIGPIIPPSIPVIIYAMVVTNASVGKLFLGGIIPGLMMGLVMMIYIYFISRKRNYPIERRPDLKTFIEAFRQGLLPVLTPVVLLTTISLGIVTVTEGAVITVLYSCFLGAVLYRQLGIKEFIGSLKRISLTIGTILVFFLAGKMFGYIFAKESLPQLVSNLFSGLSADRYVVLLVINAFFLILGCFSDPIVNIMLFVPVFMPMAASTGMDPNAFGVIIILNCMIGLITPPVGGMVYVIGGISKEPLPAIFREAVPFVVAYIIVIVVLSVFPEIITFIPDLVMRR